MAKLKSEEKNIKKTEETNVKKRPYRNREKIDDDFKKIRDVIEKTDVATIKEVKDELEKKGVFLSEDTIRRTMSIAKKPIVSKRLLVKLEERKESRKKEKENPIVSQESTDDETLKEVKTNNTTVEPAMEELPKEIIIDCSAVNKVGFFDFLSSCIINGTKIFSCNVTEYEVTKLSAGKDSSFDSKCANRLIRYYTLHSESFEHLDGPKPENGNEERDQQILDFAAEMNLTIVTGDINMAFKALSRGIKFKPFYQNISSKTPKKNVVSFKPVRVNPDSETMEFEAQPGKFRKITVNDSVINNPEKVTLKLFDTIIISSIKSDYNTIAVFKIKAIGTVNNAFLSFSRRYQKKEELPEEYRPYAL